MTVQMPFSGFVFMHRLMRICTSGHRHVRLKDIQVKLTKSRREIRTFSTSCVKFNDNEKENLDSSASSTKLTSKQALLTRRRRPLSPLERVSSLLPQDALSPEVMQLREQNQPEAEQNISTQVLESKHPDAPEEDELNIHNLSEAAVEPNAADRWSSAPLPGENFLVFGELLLAEYKKKRAEFKKMFKLQEGTRLYSSWGVIPHDNIAGQPAGQFIKTNQGVPILIRRPSLEDYVLYMRRGPAIAYPKDANTMLMMMDITEGDCVLESGSGSGAMSLFLSRAVGSKGRVLSVEVRDDHFKRAVGNYNRWRTSWSLRGRGEWPDNVQFLNTNVYTASSLLAGQGFHAIALDLTSPHLALPTVVPHLHSGAVCAVYLANITQVTDLLEGIRCMALPLMCESIIEVPVRHWMVAPALKKSGQYCTRKAPTLNKDLSDGEETEEAADETDEEESTTGEHPAFGSVPYIARPHPQQMSHTAFLIKLRKIFR